MCTPGAFHHRAAWRSLDVNLGTLCAGGLQVRLVPVDIFCGGCRVLSVVKEKLQTPTACVLLGQKIIPLHGPWEAKTCTELLCTEDGTVIEGSILFNLSDASEPIVGPSLSISSTG